MSVLKQKCFLLCFIGFLGFENLAYGAYDANIVSALRKSTTLNIGQLSINNNYAGSVTISLYHSDAPSYSFGEWLLPSASVTTLKDYRNNNAPISFGEDWGIQIIFGNGVKSDVYPISKFSSFKDGVISVDATKITLESNANNPPITTSNYIKIANDGSVLEDNASLGTKSKDWACTKDNKTGLIWEVKTNDSGLRDRDWTYSWYEPDTSKNGGNTGYQNLGSCTGSQCDTNAYTNAVNAKVLCGATNWRLPTKDELFSGGAYEPYLNKTYFPNNLPSEFWSSSSYFNDYYKTWSQWIVDFTNAGGGGQTEERNSLNNVRLVREDTGTSPVTTGSPPALTFSATPATTAYVNKNYSVTLKAIDGDDPLSNPEIVVTWGDGFTTYQGGVTSNGTSIDHIYINTGTYTWKAIANSTNGLSNQELSGTVQVSNEQVSSRYTKVCNNGKLAGESGCPIDPILGLASNDWACTKDNNTGLIWEVKTESGLHDMYNRYTWYEPTTSKNGGNAGKKNGGSCTNSQCDTYAYTNSVNKEKFCGAKDWRVPTIGELQSLIKNSGVEPSIDTTFFPNTYSFFWSSTTPTDNKSNAWGTYFYEEGYSNFFAKGGINAVRLVRGVVKQGSQNIENNEKPSFGLVQSISDKWETGQIIRVRFVNGTPVDQNKVFNVLKEWGVYANLKIEKVTKNKLGGNAVADVRIRIPGDGNTDKVSHSFIGTASLTHGFSAAGIELTEENISQPCDYKLYGNDCFIVHRMMISDYASINYAAIDSGTILHEFGHALSFKHEHTSKNAKIPWCTNGKDNYEEYIKRNNKWFEPGTTKLDEAAYKRNLFGEDTLGNPLKLVTRESEFDRYSIMAYNIPASDPVTGKCITTGGFSITQPAKLSATDIVWAGEFYPFPSPAVAKPQPVATGFYRATDKPEVYLVNAETKTFCHVASPEDMNQLGGFSQVQIMSNEDFRYGLGNQGFCPVFRQNGSCNPFKVIFGGCK